MKIVISIILFLSLALHIQCKELTPKQAYEQALSNDKAEQTWYINGVPHTDAHGNHLSQYDSKKSFFPIGMWGIPGHAPSAGYDWNDLKEIGINTVWPRRKAAVMFIEAAEKLNLKLIFMGRIPDELFTKLKDNPICLGNVWYDEPIGKLEIPGRMENMYQKFNEYKAKIKKQLPLINVFINDAPWIMPPATQWFVKWNTSGDIVCHDNYPIKISSSNVKSISVPPNGIAQSMSLTTLINKEAKPNWFIAGAFEQGFKNNDRFPYRYPTVEQLRSQVYTAIIHGATGIHYFIWDTWISREASCFGISKNPSKFKGKEFPPATPAQISQSMALWNMAAQINKELKELVPAILSSTIASTELYYKISSEFVAGNLISKNPVRGILKKMPGTNEYILISSNMDAVSLDTEFLFGRDIEQVEILFDSYPKKIKISEDKHSFSLRYEPYYSHVLKLRFKKDSKNIEITGSNNSTRIVSLPLKEARLFKCDRATPILSKNMVTQSESIYQPIIDKQSGWFIQWHTIKNIQAQKEYNLYAQIEIEGNSKSGKLLCIGGWDKKGKRHFFKHNLIIEDIMKKDKSGFIKVGKVKLPGHLDNLTWYIAPNAKSPAGGFRIMALELRKIN